MNKNAYAIIMAGGAGERFWPVGRVNKPKQLSNIAGNEAMIVSTYNRLLPIFMPENIFVITNIKYVVAIQNMLPVPPENVIGEPVGRDTAPCVALATALVKRRSTNAVMVLLPADHLLHPVKRFQELLMESLAVAENKYNSLITWGIRPRYPADCYGYIEAGEKVVGEFQEVKRFLEKPDIETARKFIEQENYYWNSGIFICSVAVMEQEFQKNCPDLAQIINDLIKSDDVEEYLEKNFLRCKKISIDYAIMEKAESVLIRSVDFIWNDVGSWSALKNIFPQDENGNTTVGNVVISDSNNCVVKSDSDTMIGIIGMQNIVVVQDGNGVLIYPLSMEKDIKALVNKLPEKWK